MKFMLVVIITMGSPVIGEEQKTFSKCWFFISYESRYHL